MTGEVAVAGVYLPALLVLAVLAVVLAWLASRLLALAGAYRLIAYRPLFDVALTILILGLLSLATGHPGQTP
ncbi:MAG: DUF1656 domain-containing protein [Sphingomonadales bacterium]|nr:DUF1656 domain-containing protein [Sphingomonadales bacterium]